MKIFTEHLDVPSILEQVKRDGYAFVKNGLHEESRQALEQEILQLPLEEGDHLHHPINKGKPNEVRQLHERAYYLLDDPAAPIATQACKNLAQEMSTYTKEYPELSGWLPNEIGYQRYRSHADWISPHRDRKSDQFFSVTFTLTGSAWINLYHPTTREVDYRHLEKIDSFLSEPGTIFFLRAPGFGSNEQIIHEVMPPINAPRHILNLRMRSTLLAAPKDTTYE